MKFYVKTKLHVYRRSMNIEDMEDMEHGTSTQLYSDGSPEGYCPIFVSGISRINGALQTSSQDHV